MTISVVACRSWNHSPNLFAAIWCVRCVSVRKRSKTWLQSTVFVVIVFHMGACEPRRDFFLLALNHTVRAINILWRVNGKNEDRYNSTSALIIHQPKQKMLPNGRWYDVIVRQKSNIYKSIIFICNSNRWMFLFRVVFCFVSFCYCHYHNNRKAD